MDAQRIVGCFTKVPRPGVSKTRLIPSEGAQGAAALQEAFLADSLACICALQSAKAVLWVSGEPDDPSITRAVGALPIKRLKQRGADLGARIESAFSEGLAEAESMVLIGSDSPTLPLRLLHRAFAALENHDAVLGPTPDGGYYVIGFRRGMAVRLAGVRWSTSNALADTLARLLEANMRYAILPPWYDVDTSEDLRLLKTHLSLDPEAAPQTTLHFDREARRD